MSEDPNTDHQIDIFSNEPVEDLPVPTPEIEPVLEETPAVVDEAEVVEAEPVEAKSENEAVVPENKPTHGFKKRIDKLTTKNKELEAEIEVLKSKIPSEIKPVADIKPENFQTPQEYFDALSEAKVDQILANREAAQIKAKEEALAKSKKQAFDEHMQIALETHKDMQELLKTASSPVSVAMHEALVESEMPGEIVYWLAKHPDECERIANLPTGKAIFEMAKIEAKLTVAPATAATVPTSKKPEVPLIRPVKGGFKISPPTEHSIEIY